MPASDPPPLPTRRPRPARRAAPGARCLPLLLALLALPAAQAQTPPRPASPAAAASAPPGAAQAQQIAAQGTTRGVPACVTCHGARGEGSAAFPRLGGTGSAYLREQLDAFADGSRANPIMQPIAKGLTPEERAALALYYSRLAPLAAAVQAPGDATPANAGAWLATRGRWADGVPACAQCHGPAGQGVGEHFPPLAGLPAAYIAQQLQAWRAGSRPPGPLQLMQTVAAKLSDADIAAVSAHYAGTAAGAQMAAAAQPSQEKGSTP